METTCQNNLTRNVCIQEETNDENQEDKLWRTPDRLARETIAITNQKNNFELYLPAESCQQALGAMFKAVPLLTHMDLDPTTERHKKLVQALAV